MPVGRYIYALEDILETARDRGLTAVEETVTATLEKAREAKRLEFSYNQTRDLTSRARGRSVVLDNKLDGLIGTIRELVRRRILGVEGDPVDEAAQLILKTNFPRGVQPIIRQSFEAQLATMTVMLEHFRGDLADAVQLTGIEREVSRMEQLVEEFRKELRVSQVPGVSYDQVQEALAEVHELTGLVRAVSIAAYPSLTQDATDARESLLAPLVEQEERVADAQRRHRRVLDIDPATGEVIGDESPVDTDQDFTEDQQPEMDLVVDAG